MSQALNGSRIKELDVLQEVARAATRAALMRYEDIRPEWKEALALGTLFEGDWRIFELYVPGERPADAIVLTSARVHRLTREVQVTVRNLQLKENDASVQSSGQT